MPKKLMYPLFLIIACLFFLSCGLLIVMLAGIKGERKPYHDRSKYRKVIKEGIFWDSYEYHER